MMEQQHTWLLDLGKVQTEPEPPAAQDTARAEEAKPSKKSSQRSPAQVLTSLEFLRDLHLPQIQKILKLCTVGSYESGQEICTIDTPSDEMYILISGELAVLTKDGEQCMKINPVTTVGELGFMTKCQRPVGLVATATSKVLRLSRSHFDRLLRSDPDIQTKVYRNIIDILSGRLIKLRDFVEGALVRNKPCPENAGSG